MEVPTRTCLACRQRSAKPSLIRLAAVDGVVQVDPLSTIQARGTYICAEQRCAEHALKRGAAAIARALRTAPAAVHVASLGARLAAEISGRTDDKVTAQPPRGVCT